MKPLERAIQSLGSQVALAEAMTKAGKKTSQQNVSWWLNEADGEVPAEYVLAMESVSGESRHALRPDVFGCEPRQAKAA